MGFDAFSPWHLLIIAVIFVILFGAKKLPDSARSLGRAMRILKAETSGLRGEDDADTGSSRAQAASPAQQLPASPRPVNDATVSGAVPETQRTNQPS